MLIGALAVLAGSPAAAAGRAIDRLWWRGRAHAEVGGRSLDLIGETALTLPLLRVRSTTYLVDQGPATARTLILDPTGQWLERDGKRTPLPAQLGIHERQQYAIYGWLLLVQQRGRPRPGRLPLSAPPYPDIVFDIGADGFPVTAELTVEAPEAGQPPIAERVAFTGRLADRGIRWPRRIAITQDGRPYFTLDVDAFRAG